MTSLLQSQMRLSDLPTRKPTTFDLVPSANERRAIAEALGITGIKKLRFSGQLSPQDRKDWVLSAQLGATVVQACVVTLDPVTTRIDEDLRRSYVDDIPAIEASEIEMLVDETVEDLPETLDIAQVMIEALSLALPTYPRTTDADLADTVFTEPGVTPMSDDDAKPFAGLGALRDRLENKDK